MRESLQALLELEANWDCRGAAAVSAAACAAAEQLAAASEACCDGWGPTFSWPLEDGGVALEWVLYSPEGVAAAAAEPDQELGAFVVSVRPDGRTFDSLLATEPGAGAVAGAGGPARTQALSAAQMLDLVCAVAQVAPQGVARPALSAALHAAATVPAATATTAARAQ